MAQSQARQGIGHLALPSHSLTHSLTMILTKDADGPETPIKKGSDDVTRQNNRQAGEYPKATQQSTALRLLGERTRMSVLAGTSSAPLTLFLMMLFLSLSLSLCFCAFVLRHGSRICLTQTIAAGFASRAHRPLEHFNCPRRASRTFWSPISSSTSSVQ